MTPSMSPPRRTIVFITLTLTLTQTEDNDYSRECRETLLAKADGSYVAPGTIVAAVFGALAFLCLCGGVAYYFKRQKDSNVPPPPKAPGAAY